MEFMTRVRWVFARRPMLWWALIAVLAAAAAGITVQAVRRVEVQRRTWGATQQVWVVVADTAPGAALATQARSYPTAMVPAAAVRKSPGVVTARHALGAGEIVVAGDVTAAGTAGLMAAGSVAVAVPIRPSPHLTVGAAVAAFANGARLADGTVVAVDDGQVVIAVPAADAAALTLAVPGGTVVVGLLP